MKWRTALVSELTEQEARLSSEPRLCNYRRANPQSRLGSLPSSPEALRGQRSASSRRPADRLTQIFALFFLSVKSFLRDLNWF